MANTTSVTDKFFPVASAEFSDNLATSISANAGTVPINSLAEYADGDIVVLTVDPGTALQATFVGTKQGNSVIGCVWTEGATGAGHANGAVVVDYVSATHIDILTQGLLKFFNRDATVRSGVITGDAMVDNTIPGAKVVDKSITSAKINGGAVTNGKLALGSVAYHLEGQGTYSTGATFQDVTGSTGTGGPSTTFVMPDDCTALLVVGAFDWQSQTGGTFDLKGQVVLNGAVSSFGKKAKFTSVGMYNGATSALQDIFTGLTPSATYTVKMQVNSTSGTLQLSGEGTLIRLIPVAS